MFFFQNHWAKFNQIWHNDFANRGSLILKKEIMIILLGINVIV